VSELKPLTDGQRVFVWWTIAIGVLFWGFQFTFATFKAAYERAFNFNCRTNLSVLSAAMLAYSEDNDGRLPPSTVWYGVLPGVGEDRMACPLAHEMGSGYAMSKAMSFGRVKAIPSLAGAPLLFDSQLRGRNAAGDLSSLPSPPRHGTTWPLAEDPPHNNVAYADGHVARVQGRR
jgi:prepilin-type processing-associated H-X9-DG protein